MAAALPAMAAAGITLTRHSRLYASPPAYVTDQPPFLNAAVAGTTRLPPAALLRALKAVEAGAGRGGGGVRFGPRPLDLDIIFYGGLTGEVPGDGAPLPVAAPVPERGAGPPPPSSWSLTLPHPRWAERPFVLAPLADLFSWDEVAAGEAGGAASPLLLAAHRAWMASGGEAQFGREGGEGGEAGGAAAMPPPPPPPLRPVLALPHGFGPWQVQGRGPAGPAVMAILNATPDSFSDGGLLVAAGEVGGAVNVGAAVAAARAAVEAGATALDVGGASTRPGASPVPPELEAGRVLPIVRALASDPALRRTPISVDTFHASVAAAALAAGAHMVNDVSGGRADAGMLAAVAAAGCPLLSMHSRGGPDSFHAPSHSDYSRDGGVLAAVGAGLRERRSAAMAAGIPGWQVVLDPGLGFGKDAPASLELLGRLPTLRAAIGGDGRVAPLLVGPSRKRFLGAALGRDTAPAERDGATTAAAALAAAGGADLLRVHAPLSGVDGGRVGAAVRAAVRSAEAREGVLEEQVALSLMRTLEGDVSE